MTKEQIERMEVLLKATKDILNKCNQSSYVLEVMAVTAIWDEAECDGNCLLEEVTELLEEISWDKKDEAKS